MMGDGGNVTIKSLYHEYGNELQKPYGVSDEVFFRWQRQVYTWKDTGRDILDTKDWRLVPSSSRTRIKIQLGNGEFLYTSNYHYAYDSKRRTLYIWKDFNADPTQWPGNFDWIIEMTTCPEQIVE